MLGCLKSVLNECLDDKQVYGLCKSAWCAVLINCIKEIEMWMSSNHLKLNTNKTQFICLRTKQQLAKVWSQTHPLRNNYFSVNRSYMPRCSSRQWVCHSHKEAIRILFLSSSPVENNSMHHHYWCSKNACKCFHHQLNWLLQNCICTFSCRPSASFTICS